MKREKPPGLARVIDDLAALADKSGDEGLAGAVDILAAAVPADCHALLRIIPAGSRVDILMCTGVDCPPFEVGRSLEAPGFAGQVINLVGHEPAAVAGFTAEDTPGWLAGLKTVLLAKDRLPDLADDPFLAVIAGRGGSEPFAHHQIESFSVLARFLLLMVRYYNLAGHFRAHSPAEHDPVTGLPLYSTFHEALEREISRARRKENGHLGISLIAVISARGDQMGDHFDGDHGLLRGIAAFLREHFRDFDTVARYGAYGFSVLLPDVSDEEALKVTDRVLGQLRLFVEDQVPAEVAVVRAGVASYPSDGTNAERLLEKAEAALGQAAERGSAEAVRWLG
ncbi:MAG: GGDEF domain-containing protein [bacterium]|nr:MAG: GGDEF domain-containing protein [bacterium]